MSAIQNNRTPCGETGESRIHKIGHGKSRKTDKDPVLALLVDLKGFGIQFNLTIRPVDGCSAGEKLATVYENQNLAKHSRNGEQHQISNFHDLIVG
jgi:hypothetical protein